MVRYFRLQYYNLILSFQNKKQSYFLKIKNKQFYNVMRYLFNNLYVLTVKIVAWAI